MNSLVRGEMEAGKYNANYKKASHGDLVTIVLELNTFVDMVKNRISTYMDKYVGLARARVAFVYYMDKPSKNLY